MSYIKSNLGIFCGMFSIFFRNISSIDNQITFPNSHWDKPADSSPDSGENNHKKIEIRTVYGFHQNRNTINQWKFLAHVRVHCLPPHPHPDRPSDHDRAAIKGRGLRLHQIQQRPQPQCILSLIPILKKFLFGNP